MECEDKEAERIFRSYIDYPETWKFTICKGAKGLTCTAEGGCVKIGEFYRVKFYWEGRKRKWLIKSVKNLTNDRTMPLYVEEEMFRQFAAHKARYLANKAG